MINQVDIVKDLLAPLIHAEKGDLTEHINWNAITKGFIMHEVDSKPLYAEIYKLELADPEEILSKLPELHQLFITELAEAYVIDKSSITSRELLESPLFKDKVSYFRTLKNVIAKQERERIIKELPKMADHLDFSLSNDEIEYAIKKKARTGLTEKFDKWDKELISEKENEKTYSSYIDLKDLTDKSLKPDFSVEKKDKVISLTWIKYLATAAILILAFFIWQPTQSSDNELLAYYSANLESLTNSNFNALDIKNTDGSERGGDIILNNYSKIETEKALAGLSYFKSGNYDRAKKIFIELKPMEHNNQILFFLALSQLNTNDIDASILNLEYLLIQPEFSFSDDVKFHLAIGYLKKGFRSKSKNLLKGLVANDGEIGQQASLILNEMRWF